MFNKKWFIKHQKLLLILANTKVGRWLLRIDTKEKIIHIEPNAIWWNKGKKYVAEFRTHDKYSKRLYYSLYPLWRLAHAWDSLWYPHFNLGFDTLGPIYPAAGESSPVDGFCARFGVNVTWATLVGASTGENYGASNTSHNMNYIQSTTTSNQFTEIDREFFCFDTTSLSGANVSAAVFSLYVDSQGNAFGGTLTHNLVSANLTSTSNIVAGDFDGVGGDTFASITNGSFNTSAYNDWTLNATGLANLNLGGISQFALRSNWDILASFGGTWTSSNTAQFGSYFADQTGTTNDPKLVVTYTLPSVLNLTSKIW